MLIFDFILSHPMISSLLEIVSFILLWLALRQL